MARRGVELIVGARRDPQFGPLVLVGLGGIFAEVLDDVVLGLAPLHPDDALEMLGGLRHAQVLDGARGRRPVNRRAVAALLVALGDAMARNPGWIEVDLNPVIAGPDRGDRRRRADRRRRGRPGVGLRGPWRRGRDA